MENLNSVAYINKINNITPIEGADKIELATVQGWSSIVAKGTHKVGDLVLCITQDAVIPEELATQWGLIGYLRKGNRVRTVKLKGVYSECILIPLCDVPGYIEWKYKEGKDLVEELKIFKYEPPAVQVQDSKGRKHKYHQNPNFHIYYKFPNIKNTPNMFTEEDDVVITRKIHGTNARYGIVKKTNIKFWDKLVNFFKRDPWFEYEYVYGSHNVEKGSDSQGFYSTDVWKEIMEKYDLKNKLWFMLQDYSIEDIGSGFILYGEIFGPGIQKNYDYGLKEIEFKAFDIEINSEFLPNINFEIRCKTWGIPIVDKLYSGNWSKQQQDSLLDQKIENSDVWHEGLVIKSIDGNKRKRAKIVSSNYLIMAEKMNVSDFH